MKCLVMLSVVGLLLSPLAASAACVVVPQGSAPTCQDCRVSFTWSGKLMTGAKLTGNPPASFGGLAVNLTKRPVASVGSVEDMKGDYLGGNGIRIDLKAALSQLRLKKRLTVVVGYAEGESCFLVPYTVNYNPTPLP